MNTAELKEFVALEKERAEIKKRDKEIVARLGELDTSITKQFLDDGTQSINIDGRCVYLHRDIWASPKEEGGRAQVVEALKACELSQYVAENYNAQSLTAYVREMVHDAEARALEQGSVLDDPAKALPERLAEAVKVSTVFSVSSRKS